MNTKVQLGGSVLLLLMIGAVNLQAQIRVGAPAPTSAHANTTAATGFGTAPNGKTGGPTPLPVQSYAVIDFGTADLVALDDAHHFALARQDASNITVQTLTNGVLSGPQIYALTVSSPTENDSYTFSYLRTNGQIAGSKDYYYIDAQGNPTGSGLGVALFGPGTAETDLPLPVPYTLDVTMPDGSVGIPYDQNENTQIGGAFVEGGYGLQCVYFGITQPDGTLFNQARPSTGVPLLNTLVSAGGTVVFDPMAPAFLADTDTVRYVRQPFAPVDMNDTGAALSPDAKLWDGQNIVATGVAANRAAFCLNNQNWFLTDNNFYSPDPAGAIWNANRETLFTDLLKDGAWVGQLTQVQPQILSNQNTTDGSLCAVTGLLDKGVAEAVLWKGVPTAALFQGSGAAAPLTWQPFRMQFPANVDAASLSFEVISSSGVIAAVGNAGTGDGHALLLVPISLRLLNGKTTDFDGTKVASLIKAPENPNYGNEVTEESYSDVHGTFVKDDTLGPKLPGQGRNGGNGYFYDTLVAAKAPLVPWLHYRWKRRVFDLQWYLRKQQNPSRWEVSYKEHVSPGDDNGNAYEFANDAPSAIRSEFYCFDDSGIAYDPSTGKDPDHVHDSWSHVGDYAYGEKVFSYTVQYSLDKPGWAGDNADWKDGVEMFVSHKLLVQVIQSSMVVQNAWKGILNEFYEGKIDPEIDKDKARSIVGGSLPIKIDDSAIIFDQDNPPDYPE